MPTARPSTHEFAVTVRMPDNAAVEVWLAWGDALRLDVVDSHGDRRGDHLADRCH